MEMGQAILKTPVLQHIFFLHFMVDWQISNGINAPEGLGHRSVMPVHVQLATKEREEPELRFTR